MTTSKPAHPNSSSAPSPTATRTCWHKRNGWWRKSYPRSPPAGPAKEKPPPDNPPGGQPLIRQWLLHHRHPAAVLDHRQERLGRPVMLVRPKRIGIPVHVGEFVQALHRGHQTVDRQVPARPFQGLQRDLSARYPGLADIVQI